MTIQIPEQGSDAAHGELMNHGVAITRGVYWVADGSHVFRSTEFDVFAEADDHDAALAMFMDNMYDHLEHLHELVRARDATQHELDAFVTLSERFVEAARRHEYEREPAIALNFLRRGRRGRTWRSVPENSSTLSHA